VFEASHPFLFFDYFRIPYRQCAHAPDPPQALSERNPLRSCGRVWTRSGSARGRRTLYWPIAPGDAAGRHAGGRVGRCHVDGIPIFGHVVPDSVSRTWLSETGTSWRPTSSIVDAAGSRVASVWQDEKGNIFLPFDSQEAISNYWSEAYQTIGKSVVGRNLQAGVVHGYYYLRPLISRQRQVQLRRALSVLQRRTSFPRWPIESALHDLYEWLFRRIVELAGTEVPWLAPWPHGHSWALVLTHDVETRVGYNNLHLLREMERPLGYRSSWNFVPTRYEVSQTDLVALINEGCEIGVHGLHHDGRDLRSLRTIRRRLPAMREYASRWNASGFRSPATHRVWDWMPLLGFDYDSSYPDTDPFEPNPGGCCSYLPFRNQETVELPITLPQDHTLFLILQHSNGWVWTQKAHHIRSHGGMVLSLTHPDYALDGRVVDAYRGLLETFEADSTAWRALPREVSQWWRQRGDSQLEPAENGWRIVGPAAAEGRIRFARADTGLRPVVASGLAESKPTSSADSTLRPEVPQAARPAPSVSANGGPGSAGHVLAIVENVPFALDHRLCKQVDTLLGQGYRVSVITRRHPRNGLHRSTPGLRLLEYRPPAESGRATGYVFEYGYSLVMAWTLALRARLERRIDIAQLCQPPDIYFALGITLRVLGCRLVVDQRDLLPELYMARYARPNRMMLATLQRLERLSHKVAGRVICVNDYLKERAIKSSGLSPDSVTVVGNGPVLSRVERAKPDATLKHGRTYMCCWVGMMGRQDRLDLLLRSIQFLVYSVGRTDCHFVVIGNGECFASAKALCKELELDQWVTFTGWVPEESVFRFLATADVGLDASLQPEVSPVKAMEYMAFGVPLVSFDLPETRATAQQAATYASLGDVHGLARAIDSLLNDPERRAAMGRIGRQRVRENLAWDRQAVIYLRVIEGLRNRGTSRRQHVL
jgi:glycosyltransferase involved in cell wall biosynthesis